MLDNISQVSRKHGVLALAGVGLLVVGLAGGLVIGGRMTARAASDTPTQPAVPTQGAARYCQIYENALASDLHISAATLERENLDAIHQTLDALVKDGQLTSFEEGQLLQFAQQLGAQPCTHLGGDTLSTLGTLLQGDTALMQQFLAARTALVGAVAKSLGLSAADLQSDLAEGQTVAQLAQARHISISTRPRGIWHRR